MVSPYYSTSTKAQASVAEHYRLTGPSFLRNRTLPDIAPCGAPGTRHGGPVGSQQPAKWGDSLRHLHPSKADTGLARSDGDDRAQDGRGRQSIRARALPIRYWTDTLGLREPLPNRYRTATDPLPLACSPGACIAGSAGPVLPAIMPTNRLSLATVHSVELRGNAANPPEIRYRTATIPLPQSIATSASGITSGG